jgi:hypothetical protein
VWEGWHREVSSYPDQLPITESPAKSLPNARGGSGAFEVGEGEAAEIAQLHRLFSFGASGAVTPSAFGVRPYAARARAILAFLRSSHWVFSTRKDAALCSILVSPASLRGGEAVPYRCAAISK